MAAAEPAAAAAAAECGHCRQPIPAANLATHEAFCRRNNAVCPDCGEVVRRDELDAHHAEVHATTPCPDCGEAVRTSELEAHHAAHHAMATCPQCGSEVLQALLATHTENECLLRSVECEFCNLPMPFVDLLAHQETCGVRTDVCTLCLRYIKLRDMARHTESNCQWPEPPPPAPPQGPSTEATLDQMRAHVLDDFFYLPPSQLPGARPARGAPTPEPALPPIATRFRQPSPVQSQSRPRPQPQPQSQPQPQPRAPSRDQVSCPFCGAECADYEQLQIHCLTDCTAYASADPAEAALLLPSSSAPPPPIDDLPCEFCHAAFPMSAIMEHQVSCPQRPGRGAPSPSSTPAPVRLPPATSQRRQPAPAPARRTAAPAPAPARTRRAPVRSPAPTTAPLASRSTPASRRTTTQPSTTPARRARAPAPTVSQPTVANRRAPAARPTRTTTSTHGRGGGSSSTSTRRTDRAAPPAARTRVRPPSGGVTLSPIAGRPIERGPSNERFGSVSSSAILR